MGLKVSKNVILPKTDRIEDIEARKVIDQLLRVIQDMNTIYYSDLTYLQEQITDLDERVTALE